MSVCLCTIIHGTVSYYTGTNIFLASAGDIVECSSTNSASLETTRRVAAPRKDEVVFPQIIPCCLFGLPSDHDMLQAHTFINTFINT